MADPLAPFRRRLEKEKEKPPTPAVVPVLHGKEVYEAFNAVDRERKRLHIRPLIQPWVWATNSYLQYIAEDNGSGTRFNLVFGFLVVKGRNLSKMIAAINLVNCEFIEEFDPSRYAPPGPAEAVIESIQYHMDKNKRDDVLDDVQREGAAGKRKLEKA